MTTETASNINIKGVRDGLMITLSSMPSFEEIDQELATELNQKRDFLRGSRVVLEVGGRKLSREQLLAWQDFMAQNGLALWAVLSMREPTREAARDLGLATRLPGSQMDLQGNGPPELVYESAREGGRDSRPTAVANNTLLLRETLRSGRAIYHEGHVVIMGDVNPGAEVVAEGNVLVWGKLRGLVHAGASGDEQAVVCALDLSPTQLRIADRIAITPPRRSGTAVPEMAHIQDDQITAVGWS
ncbi:MAG: septum site-determining protein MinC [Anaerolineales bacterium]|nr:septum site-determining protein MinC [Anaerolineales bacterium]